MMKVSIKYAMIHFNGIVFDQMQQALRTLDQAIHSNIQLSATDEVLLDFDTYGIA